MKRFGFGLLSTHALTAGALLLAVTTSGCLIETRSTAEPETISPTEPEGTEPESAPGSPTPETPAPNVVDPDVATPDAPSPDAAPDAEPAFVAEAQAGLEIDTEAGRVEGTQDGNLRIFRGIPYAEAPIGNQRFLPPQKKGPWTGTFPADAYGPSCPQGNLGSLVLGDSGMSEDCLSVNVWAHDDGQERPVMVFIYGGAFIMGTTAQPLYEAAKLARRGDVTVVTMNYRLGALGWLASQAIADDLGTATSGNYGVHDQIEALRWVQTNIRAFGGNPDNVTIFGESAGAISVCALLGAPSADDLFDKAIIESGMCALGTYDGAGLIGMPSASVLAERVVEEVGCQDAFNIADCLRSKTTDELLDATSLLDVITGDLQTISALSPIVDGSLIPEQPITRMRRGDVNKPIIVGSNHDEGLLFTAADLVLTRGGFANKVEDLMGEGPHVDAVVDIYPWQDFPIVKDAWVALMGEATFICPGLEVARASSPTMPVFTYHFERRPLPMIAIGAMHGLELPYVFGNFSSLALIPTSTDLAVSDAMQGAWSTFARHGAPSLSAGWDRYDVEAPAIAIFDSQIEIVDGIRNGRCDMLRDIGIVF